MLHEHGALMPGKSMNRLRDSMMELPLKTLHLHQCKFSGGLVA